LLLLIFLFHYTQNNYILYAWCMVKLVKLEPGKSKIKSVYVIYGKVIYYGHCFKSIIKALKIGFISFDLGNPAVDRFERFCLVLFKNHC